MEQKKYDVYLRNKNSPLEGTLIIGEHSKTSVRLLVENYDSGSIDQEQIYESMCSLHKKLDQCGIKLMCNCFRYDIRPSAMAISMGNSRLAYKMYIGKQATELVDIFDRTEDKDAVVTFEDQEAFFDKWLDSL